MVIKKTESKAQVSKKDVNLVKEKVHRGNGGRNDCLLYERVELGRNVDCLLFFALVPIACFFLFSFAFLTSCLPFFC
jgi:hypothetical protein